MAKPAKTAPVSNGDFPAASENTAFTPGTSEAATSKGGRKAYESKSAAFKAVGGKFVTSALERIEALGGLTAGRYKYTAEQVDKMELVLTDAVRFQVNKLRDHLNAPATAKKAELVFEL